MGAAMATLYERILGVRYGQLHPVLRAFHSQSGVAVADCRLDVTHPPGVLKSLFRKLAGMPSAGRHETTLLEAHARPYGEEWRRTIGGKLMITKQWQSGSLLMEGVGPAVLGIELHCEQGGMRFETKRFWVLGVPIFKAISPSVFARVTPLEKSWQVEVRLTAPWLGPILIYEGEVTPR
jgi:Domain of unknown function (DUF4166)